MKSFEIPAIQGYRSWGPWLEQAIGLINVVSAFWDIGLRESTLCLGSQSDVPWPVVGFVGYGAKFAVLPVVGPGAYTGCKTAAGVAARRSLLTRQRRVGQLVRSSKRPNVKARLGRIVP